MSAVLKETRILELYDRFCAGELIKKGEEAERYGVNVRSIQRDINTLRAYFTDHDHRSEIVFDRVQKGYRLIECDTQKFTNEETLAVIKILLESRSLVATEMFPMIEKVLLNCVPKQHIPMIKRLIANEQHLYSEPHHGAEILETLWAAAEAVSQQKRISIEYNKMGQEQPVTRLVEPVGIMFSEYYFYLIAYIADSEIRDYLKSENKDRYPAIYRIDRIRALKETQEHFRIPYLERFQEGEFRKRVQFMYGGQLQTVRFQYMGPSVEAVLDRLPSAEIEKEEDGIYTIQAEVFGDGIKMWLRSQGDYVKVLGGCDESGK